MRTDGYYSGIPYPAMFHRELTPLWLASTLEALGLRPPDINGDFTWCELGCGSGFGLTMAAAAYPQAHFLGVDIDPAHIASARHLTAQAGLCNVAFHLDDFAHWAVRDALPSCDFIVLHGVFSWLSADRRQAVLDIIERMLKPGGVCYLAYMSHPGASSMQSLQHLLAGHGERAMTQGWQLLSALARGGAGQFVETPGLRGQLLHLQDEPAGYLAHEFLGRHWQPLHASEAMLAMRSIGCDYLGSATPIENIDAVSLPQGVRDTIAGIDDPGLREVAKDIARNQSQRRDVYQRGRQPLTAMEHRQTLARQRWCLLPSAPAPGKIRLDTRIGPVEGAEAVFAPLLARLAEGPQSFAELLSLSVFQDNGGLLNQSLQMMLWAGWAHPLHGESGHAECLRLNQAIGGQRMLGHALPALAVAGLGGGISASRIEMACYLALTASPGLTGVALRDSVRMVSGEAAAEADLADIETRVLPRWRQLGLLAGSSMGPAH